ncbi:putative pollen-specific leucine-rich repeat extensin-like protein 3 [Iris pallida]|uniref:Pollen-specific leucine-rich repeat extensin-like protein 3 n=1 Tax=Iris pallida TaxID=29817 RepID=A0AAX6GWT8_IRIPA|nr:putative pollen-specific leucine-rich repeat extensin-like protein 3 [Iris pallida]
MSRSGPTELGAGGQLLLKADSGDAQCCARRDGGGLWSPVRRRRWCTRRGGRRHYGDRSPRSGGRDLDSHGRTAPRSRKGAGATVSRAGPAESTW